MNFYYDPIMGLQYDNTGFHIAMDLEAIPKGLDFKEFMKQWREMRTITVLQPIDFNMQCTPNITQDYLR